MLQHLWQHARLASLLTCICCSTSDSMLGWPRSSSRRAFSCSYNSADASLLNPAERWSWRLRTERFSSVSSEIDIHLPCWAVSIFYISFQVLCIPVKLPWIFPGAPLTFYGTPGNIQGNLTGIDVCENGLSQWQEKLHLQHLLSMAETVFTWFEMIDAKTDPDLMTLVNCCLTLWAWKSYCHWGSKQNFNSHVQKKDTCTHTEEPPNICQIQWEEKALQKPVVIPPFHPTLAHVCGRWLKIKQNIF